MDFTNFWILKKSGKNREKNLKIKFRKNRKISCLAYKIIADHAKKLFPCISEDFRVFEILVTQPIFSENIIDFTDNIDKIENPDFRHFQPPKKIFKNGVMNNFFRKT